MKIGSFGELNYLDDFTISLPTMVNYSKEIEKLNQQRAWQQEEDRKVQLESLNALRGIERNTGVLGDIVTLLQSNQEKQEEVFSIVIEMLEMTKSSNKEEIDSIYRRVMDRVQKFSGDIQAIKSLMALGASIHSFVSPLLQHPK